MHKCGIQLWQHNLIILNIIQRNRQAIRKIDNLVMSATLKKTVNERLSNHQLNDRRSRLLKTLTIDNYFLSMIDVF